MWSPGPPLNPNVQPWGSPPHQQGGAPFPMAPGAASAGFPPFNHYSGYDFFLLRYCVLCFVVRNFCPTMTLSLGSNLLEGNFFTLG